MPTLIEENTHVIKARKVCNSSLEPLKHSMLGCSSELLSYFKSKVVVHVKA